MLTESLILLRWRFVLLQPFTDGEMMNFLHWLVVICAFLLGVGIATIIEMHRNTMKNVRSIWANSDEDMKNSLTLKHAVQPIFQSVKDSLEATDVKVFVSLELCCGTCQRNMFAIGLIWWEPAPATAATAFGMSTHQVAALFCSCCHAALTSASRYVYLHDAVEALSTCKKTPAQIRGLIASRRRFQDANARKIADLQLDLLELEQASSPPVR